MSRRPYEAPDDRAFSFFLMIFVISGYSSLKWAAGASSGGHQEPRRDALTSIQGSPGGRNVPGRCLNDFEKEK